jgi:hypothetical protein
MDARDAPHDLEVDMIHSVGVRTAVHATCAALLLSGCSTGNIGPHAGSDASAAEDASRGADAGLPDVWFPDAFVYDAAPPDDGIVHDMDAGSNEAGFFGAPRCASSGALLCEDFEGSSVGAAWTVDTSAATASIASDRAARGIHSLHIHAGPAGSRAFISTRQIFPPSDDIFGRAFYYMVEPLEMAHATFFDVSAPSPYNTWRYGANQGHLFVNYYGSSPELGTQSATAQPTYRWVCFEWEFKASNHELHFWMDEHEITDIAITQDLGYVAASWTDLQVGWEHYETDSVTGFDLWVDEVAVDRQRIGCSR